jgi:anaerobic nitric oxide reductase transcription regulator
MQQRSCRNGNVAQLEALVSIASDLTAALSSDERYRRLLVALRRVIPYDAATLMQLEGDALVPLACEGFSADAMGRRYPLREQPRLEIICRSERPVLFPSDSALPDPFDGMLASGGSGEFQHIHACLGCPLRVGGELIGTLTADAARPHAFDGIEPGFLAAIGALAAAELQTTRLIAALERGAERQGLIVRDLMRDVELRGSEMIGTSAVVQRLRQEIDLVSRSDVPVLILGETGVGKELVARALHAASRRHSDPMLYVNCAALPETLADSELFGHVRGAFTGATADRAGKFEVASGGTLFLDEIGELPLSVQPKLLRALQEGEIQRVGSDRVIRADVRLIAATNRDLEQEVRAGRFRADLFHRLAVYPLRVAPLRERAQDIPLLAGYFCDVARRRLGLGQVRLDPSAIAALKAYSWPGNVRELENVLTRVTLKAASRVPRGSPIVLGEAHLGAELEPGTLPATAAPVEPNAPVGGDLKEATREFQRMTIRRALAENGGNWAAAARTLGMHRSNLHHLATRLGLKAPQD